jgi:hypothetical protein
VLVGAEHGQEDVAAPPGETDERRVVTFTFDPFAIVEGLGGANALQRK